MTAYLTTSEFLNLTVMPPEFLDAIEERTPGWTDAQLEAMSRWIDARLSKRYAVPFATPVPTLVQSWLASLVTLRCFHRRGVDPLDQQMTEIKADRDAALAEIKEAADAAAGLFELPLRADTTTSGITKHMTAVRSEQSPYVALDMQAATGRREDANGGPTYG